MDVTTFDLWLLKQDSLKLPLVSWGPGHTKIAMLFASDMVKLAIHNTLDHALNSGNGSYKP